MTRDLCYEFAEYAVDTRFESIPASAVEAAKKSTLDLFGVILASSGLEPAVRGLVELVHETGGRPESTVLGFPGHVPAVWAAFANGAMAHGLDFDDLTPWGNHASSSIVPAAFAVAERRGGVTGKDLIAAIAVGQDLFARLLCNVEWRKDWNMSTVAGTFAGAAACGRVLGLPADQMANALSIASMQSAGTMEVVYGIGGDMRGMYAAFSAKAAALSALLAHRGLTGVKSAFEGKVGFFNTYFHGHYQRDKMLEGLGRDYLGDTTLFKPWPAVGPSHSHIHATIQLVTTHDLGLGDIEEIRVHAGDYQQIMCAPLESRRVPATLVDAKFSLPFLVAVAAVHRGVKIWNFTGDALRDPQVLAMARKVVPVPDAAYDWKYELPLGRVVIVTKDGRSLDLVGTNVPGSAEAPLDWDRVASKFAECASVAAAPPSGRQIETASRIARELESFEDATELLRVLQPSG